MIKTLKEKHDIDFNKHELNDEFIKLYKNIRGIYIIYNEFTKEAYIGKTNNISNRIQQHYKNTNFIVADMIKKPKTVIYTYILNTEDDFNKYAKLMEIYLIAEVNSLDVICLNIEFNFKHPLYLKSVRDGKIKNHKNSLSIIKELRLAKFIYKKGLIETIDIYLSNDFKTLMDDVKEANINAKIKNSEYEDLKLKAKYNKDKISTILDHFIKIENIMIQHLDKNDKLIKINVDDYLKRISDIDLKDMLNKKSMLIIDLDNISKFDISIGFENYKNSIGSQLYSKILTLNNKYSFNIRKSSSIFYPFKNIYLFKDVYYNLESKYQIILEKQFSGIYLKKQFETKDMINLIIRLKPERPIDNGYGIIIDDKIYLIIDKITREKLDIINL